MSDCCGCGQPKDGPGVLSGRIRKIKKMFRDKSLIAIFEHRLKAKKIPGKNIAIHFQERITLTYDQLNTFASCLAKNITERLGYDYGSENPDNELVIAICLPMSEKAIALILGIMKTGAAYLPLDPTHPENLLLEIVTKVKPIMLITDDNGKIFNKYDSESFSAICKLCTIEELWIDADFPQDPRKRLPSMEKAWDIDFLRNSKSDVPIDERPVAIFYSRGLVNNVVGVRVATKSIVNLISYHWNRVGQYSKSDSCCVTVSLANSVSIPQVFLPLLCGCSIHLFRRTDVTNTDNFVKNLAWRNITKLSLESYILPEILESIEFLGPSSMVKLLQNLNRVTCRGGFVPYDTIKHFFDIFNRGVSLINCIGAPEVSGEATLEQYHSFKDYESKIVDGIPTTGSVVDNVKIYVADENMALVPDGKEGEVYVSGDCLAIGFVNENAIPSDDPCRYLANPFATEPRFDRLFKSGEFAHIQKINSGQRRLVMHGRKDALVRARGNMFSTDDVTQFVKKLEGVSDAFVCVFFPRTRDQAMVAFIELTRGVAESHSLTADYDFTLKGQLPEWAVPDEFRVFHGCQPECENYELKKLCPACCKKTLEQESKPKHAVPMPMNSKQELSSSTASSTQFG